MSIRFSEESPAALRSIPEMEESPAALSSAREVHLTLLVSSKRRRRQSVKKRVFDLVVCAASSLLWIPTCIVAALILVVAEGRPVLYRSIRRTHRGNSTRIMKFRTMVRDAESIANRETLPINRGQRFLNIPIDSVLYTRVGRWIERLNLTEIPQFVHVIAGKMSVVGNRPLPENVISSLKETHDDVEHRFISRCGLTGPVQLIGRDRLTDSDRLRLECAYSKWALESYSPLVDFKILLHTVLVGLHLMRTKSVDELMSWFEQG